MLSEVVEYEILGLTERKYGGKYGERDLRKDEGLC